MRQDARVQLDLLSRNASWAESLFKGNVETRKQFDELVAKAAAGDDVGDAVAGIVEPAVPLFETPQTVSCRAGTSRGRSQACGMPG